MKRKLTDFELAALGSIGAVIADLNWLVFDIIHAGRVDHAVTSVGLLLAGIVTVVAWIRHIKTGSKPVQSNDDIDYRIKLYVQKAKFETMCKKERAIRNKQLDRRV